jgi:serine O-acetyltransferase
MPGDNGTADQTHRDGLPSPRTPPPRPPPPPLPTGATNENPKGISFLALLAEDLKTHDNDPLQPGFIAVAVHRFGNWRMDKPKLVRAPLTVAYKVLFTAVDIGLGIDLSYTVKLGRRVRLWHHGGMILGARSIGDDVHIRQNTTLGILSRDELRAKPVIEDRVDIGAGACILGNVTVGHDTVIGANTVVVKDEPPHSTLFGIPARPVKLS